jgi:hypothetical protein
MGHGHTRAWGMGLSEQALQGWVGAFWVFCRTSELGVSGGFCGTVSNTGSGEADWDGGFSGGGESSRIDYAGGAEVCWRGGMAAERGNVGE